MANLKNFVKESRKGLLEIPFAFADHYPYLALKVMSKIIVTSAEWTSTIKGYTYQGYSPLFDISNTFSVVYEIQFIDLNGNFEFVLKGI